METPRRPISWAPVVATLAALTIVAWWSSRTPVAMNEPRPQIPAVFAIPDEHDPDHVSKKARHLLAGGCVTGVQLGLFSREPEYDYASLLDEIVATGSPWVALTINSYQERNDSIALGIPDERTATEARVRTTIRQARQRGLHVMLFPILLLRDPGEDDWRGTLAPSDRDEWFHSYECLISFYAQIADDEGVELLSIGSEFNSLQGDTDAWRALIRKIRERFRGALTYSANWDSLAGVGFIDALDFVGMTTYFSLSDRNDPSIDAMAKTWRDIASDIGEWRAFHRTPLLFTEVGYPSQDGANRNPWNYFQSNVVDVDEQRDCFAAFAKVWTGNPTIDGVFFYNWFGRGGPLDTGYTPRGKPALEVIRRWFGEARARHAAVDSESGD